MPKAPKSKTKTTKAKHRSTKKKPSVESPLSFRESKTVRIQKASKG